jgi:purine-binding chemotaxis protein CheW
MTRTDLELQFLTFRVGSEMYGVDIASIQEIKGWVATNDIPCAPEYMRGVLNLRGDIVPILDLQSRFGKGRIQVDPNKVVIVLGLENNTIGIVVDSVSDIIDTKPEDIINPSSIDTHIDERFIKGIISLKEHMIILLDINMLFTKETLDQANQAAVSQD